MFSTDFFYLDDIAHHTNGAEKYNMSSMKRIQTAEHQSPNIIETKS